MHNDKPALRYPVPIGRGDTVVILAPHPDDETLGCGLLIGDVVRRRARLAVVVLTDGQASHPASTRWPPAALGRLRRGETRRALARLGGSYATLRFMGWGDGRLAQDGDALSLRRLLGEIGATLVLVSSPRDFHADHQAAWRLAIDATRGTQVRLLSYAVWSRIDDPAIRPARHPWIGRKRWAIAAHRSQVSGYIDDDPAGFTFEAAPLARLVRRAEAYRPAASERGG